jgi:hypothetical protein
MKHVVRDTFALCEPGNAIRKVIDVGLERFLLEVLRRAGVDVHEARRADLALRYRLDRGRGGIDTAREDIDVVAALGGEDGERPDDASSETIDKLAAGEIDVDEALQRLKRAR